MVMLLAHPLLLMAALFSTDCLQFHKKSVVPRDVGRCCNIFKLFQWSRKETGCEKLVITSEVPSRNKALS